MLHRIITDYITNKSPRLVSHQRPTEPHFNLKKIIPFGIHDLSIVKIYLRILSKCGVYNGECRETSLNKILASYSQLRRKEVF